MQTVLDALPPITCLINIHSVRGITMETWKNIDWTCGKYSVSDKGTVRNNITGKLIKATPYANGYLGVNLYLDGKNKRTRVHRLVAEAFVPNPMFAPHVNHKDENKTNNAAKNLEWCTPKENNNYGSRTKRIAQALGHKVAQYHPNGVLVGKYQSISEAARINGFTESGIRRTCNGEYKQYKGYKWQLAV